MDEKHILRCIVLLLLKHPGEWFTFGRASLSIGNPEYDADGVAALVDYRQDLFAVSDDRRFKLRTSVSEAIAQQGTSNWQVPPRPERPRLEISRDGTQANASRGRCYCSVDGRTVLRDLRSGSVPDEALVYSCCWRHICRVRGLYFGEVSEETWREICQRRGYLRERENPRGF